MEKIRAGIIGVGNCASSLVQGVSYYSDKKDKEIIGIMHWDINGYTPNAIEFACAFDIDKRKVGRPLKEAIFQSPNCTKIFTKRIERADIKVNMGCVLDGFSKHMKQYNPDNTFIVSKTKQPDRNDIIKILKDSGCEILLNYLPVGSGEATKFYAECALAANCAFINNIPVFIASDKNWQKRFKDKNIPLIGDDIKSQIGATIIHRTLTSLFKERGVKLTKTYQLNMGGNTDFLNMLNRERLISKKISKTEAVQSMTDKRLKNENIHIGPSDYIPWLKDNKICFIRMEGNIFGDVPINLELRLSVEDSPNSAGVVIDAIRCAKVAMDRGIGGILISPSAYFMKSPPHQYSDFVAKNMVDEFISGKRLS
ncbi:MAG: inositol-3-phosphate synthase [Candidatus Hydrogenedentota bacterium]